jgi:hypothetical protein
VGVVDILSVPPPKKPLYKPGFTILGMSVSMDTSCIQCNMSEDEEDFYETHQWLPDRLWCINKK